MSLSISQGVGHVELNRPARANAFDLDAARAFSAATDAVLADDDVRVVLLTGAGPRFCAGGDVASIVQSADRGAHIRELADTLDCALQRLDQASKPVVVGVQGAVAGAGLGVMLTGDLVIADRATKFVTAYTGVGLTPDCGVSWLLPRAIGQQRALQLMLTPTVLTAEDALSWGLVTQTVDTDAAVAARELAQQLARQPVFALGKARRLVRTSWSVDRATSGADESATIARAVVTDDAVRLTASFVSS